MAGPGCVIVSGIRHSFSEEISMFFCGLWLRVAHEEVLEVNVLISESSTKHYEQIYHS
jgi:hypothetical protein